MKEYEIFYRIDNTIDINTKTVSQAGNLLHALEIAIPDICEDERVNPERVFIVGHREFS